jgi:preprotein translocase subunit SecF
MPHPDGRRHTLRDLYHEDTHFDFMGRMWRWAAISAVLILAGIVGFAARGGLNLGIDFTGGTAWQVTMADGSPSSGAVRQRLAPLGLADAKILVVGGDSLRVQASELPRAEQERVTRVLADYAGVEVTQVSVSEVSPTWGSTVSTKALQALVVFFVVVAAYLSFRFEWKMAVAALAAVVHDIFVTVGVYAVFGFEVAPATVIAFLTILGFSLYDTVVVFDRVDENTPLLATERDLTYRDMVNRSLNQVLVRSLNTSLVAVLPVLAILVVGSGLFGAVSLRDFGIALLVGLLIGTYSSIFVATPLLALMKEREPRYRAVRERVASRAGRVAVAGVGGAGAVAVGGGGPEREPAGVPAGAARPVGEGGAVITPRPRQQRGRKRR